jgi:ribosomal protein L40E
MSDLDEIMQEYRSLRGKGMMPKETLRRLGSVIQGLPQERKEELADMIRRYEGRDLTVEQGGEPTQEESANIRTTQRVKSLRPGDTNPKPLRSLREKAESTENRVFCWQCGAPNPSQAMLCNRCGAVLKTGSNAATRQLDANDQNKPEQYTVDSILLFRVRDAEDVIQMRPQTLDHEIIVGRADAAGVVMPDVDLSDYGAAELGVSRMHMTVSFDRETETILVTDMDSANGVFVNGQRLAAKEKRVLRDGDQLRLAELVINVFFQHS